MIEFLFDFIINTVCFFIGSVFIKLVSFGRIRPSLENSKYPFLVAFVGLFTISFLFYITITWW